MSLLISKLMECLSTTAVDLAVIMFIIICSNASGYAIERDSCRRHFGRMITAVSDNKHGILLIVMLFVFFSGMFMEATANVLLLTPDLPADHHILWFDPVHFFGVMYMILDHNGRYDSADWCNHVHDLFDPWLSNRGIYKGIHSVCSIHYCVADSFGSIPAVGTVPRRIWIWRSINIKEGRFDDRDYHLMRFRGSNAYS